GSQSSGIPVEQSGCSPLWDG
ncbi:hypothetical protein A2U01_0031346, partial [Trifolium medium]|nr:hypothetical protein [Trifolium medium]